MATVFSSLFGSLQFLNQMVGQFFLELFYDAYSCLSWVEYSVIDEQVQFYSRREWHLVNEYKNRKSEKTEPWGTLDLINRDVNKESSTHTFSQFSILAEKFDNNDQLGLNVYDDHFSGSVNNLIWFITSLAKTLE